MPYPKDALTRLHPDGLTLLTENKKRPTGFWIPDKARYLCCIFNSGIVLPMAKTSTMTTTQRNTVRLTAPEVLSTTVDIGSKKMRLPDTRPCTPSSCKI